ncbi:hypothetical protein Q9R46_19445 [Paenibacillus sp. RRE4]|uniref:Uncharacterized protein n=1 Tax=Paenibacillus amylolyticus TaxID=1451 RepID=A0A5M9WQX7_PAEAM|nr:MULTISPECIES: hypothetical protein [Paenibacillus]KAA8783985.1 hypothetical protein EC604_09010 [Paenibacillus amylolyticus]MDT0124848.1 hypothetical protein [Paenibacillus sp. RRE4]
MFKEAKEVIRKRADLHMNDPAIEHYREELINLLSQNENETIAFLKKCSKEEILWISEVFEEISYNLQSVEYINTLKDINKKYPELKLTNVINTAVSYMD